MKSITDYTEKEIFFAYISDGDIENFRPYSGRKKNQVKGSWISWETLEKFSLPGLSLSGLSILKCAEKLDVPVDEVKKYFDKYQRVDANGFAVIPDVLYELDAEVYNEKSRKKISEACNAILNLVKFPERSIVSFKDGGGLDVYFPVWDELLTLDHIPIEGRGWSPSPEEYAEASAAIDLIDAEMNHENPEGSAGP